MSEPVCGHAIYVNDLFTRGALLMQCELVEDHAHECRCAQVVYDEAGDPVHAWMSWEPNT